MGPATGTLLGYMSEGQYLAVGGWDGKYSRQNGEYQGIPKTGKVVTIRGINWYDPP